MPSQLIVSVGQHTDKGQKSSNQDYHAFCIPKEPQLSTKGITVAMADGISSSDVSHIASQSAVAGFVSDYYCTTEAWTVKKSAEQVILALNSWLYAQSQQSQYRYDKDRGYVCTFSALIIKSTTAHLFHVGDTRIYRIVDNTLEQLTKDHRFWVSPDQSYLSRALGIDSHLEIEYRSLPLEKGDIFLLATDGVYEHITPEYIIATLKASPDNLDAAAKTLVVQAYDQGSPDNLSAQFVRIEDLPRQEANEHYQRLTELPFPPVLEARTVFDGFTIIRELHASSRSHVYLAIDSVSNERAVIKIPSINLRNDPAYLERFLMEEWIARRINSPYVLKPYAMERKRNYLYNATEYLEGQTLSQWMIDNKKPILEAVRDIVEQIAKGLRVFHRLEMLHQDLRPENIIIDNNGTVKLIDFGSVYVAGLMETDCQNRQNHVLGTAQYTAPEYFLGESGTARSDMFSLGVIAYQMLCGKLPYGAEVAKCKTRSAQYKLNYDSLRYDRPEIPAWVDDAIRKAVQPMPDKRYEDLSEFIFDLRHPNQRFLSRTRPPLLERHPLRFWQGIALVQAVIILVFLYLLAKH
ncbi:hypothetical protein MCAMS1_01060 [biofilm metagenome]